MMWGMKDENTKELAQAFRRDGHTVLSGVFDGALLEELRSLALEVKEKALSECAPGLRYWEDGSKSRHGLTQPDRFREHSWGVNEITRPSLFFPSLINVIGMPRIDALMEAILGPYRAWGQKMLWAPEVGHYDLHWHRDCNHELDELMPYQGPLNNHVQFNAALEDDSSFIVVPGSNRRPISEEEAQALATDLRGPLPGEKRIHLKAGDIVFMDAHSLHRGEAPEGSSRLSLHFSFQANWVPLRPWGEEEHFARIQSEAFLSQLNPATRKCYDALRHCTTTDAPTHQWIVDRAQAEGWEGPLQSRWPQRMAG